MSKGKRRKTELPPWFHSPDHVLEDGTSRVRIWYPSPRVMVAKGTGHMTGTITSAFVEHLSRRLDAVGRADVFDDLSDVTGYDERAFGRAVAWARADASRLSGIHVLSSSVAISAVAQLASLVLRELRAYTEADAFWGAILDALESGEEEAES